MPAYPVVVVVVIMAVTMAVTVIVAMIVIMVMLIAAMSMAFRLLMIMAVLTSDAAPLSMALFVFPRFICMMFLSACMAVIASAVAHNSSSPRSELFGVYMTLINITYEHVFIYYIMRNPLPCQ